MDKFRGEEKPRQKDAPTMERKPIIRERGPMQSLQARLIFGFVLLTSVLNYSSKVQAQDFPNSNTRFDNAMGELDEAVAQNAIDKADRANVEFAAAMNAFVDSYDEEAQPKVKIFVADYLKKTLAELEEIGGGNLGKAKVAATEEIADILREKLAKRLAVQGEGHEDKQGEGHDDEQGEIHDDKQGNARDRLRGKVSDSMDDMDEGIHAGEDFLNPSIGFAEVVADMLKVIDKGTAMDYNGMVLGHGNDGKLYFGGSVVTAESRLRIIEVVRSAQGFVEKKYPGVKF